MFEIYRHGDGDFTIYIEFPTSLVYFTISPTHIRISFGKEIEEKIKEFFIAEKNNNINLMIVDK